MLVGYEQYRWKSGKNDQEMMYNRGHVREDEIAKTPIQWTTIINYLK